MRCRISRRTRDTGKDVERVRKETAGKRNGSKSCVNGDDGVKMFWAIYFVWGGQGLKNGRCPTRKESEKKATAQPQRLSSAIVPFTGVSARARLRAPSPASSSVPQDPASRTRTAVAGKLTVSYRTVSVETQE